jgi:hypothetical protein
MDQEAFIARLNALAAHIPPGAFCVGDNRLDCATYVTVFRGKGTHVYRRAGHEWKIRNGTVLYAGEGHPRRATEQFKRRGKVCGFAGKDFDDFIAANWPDDPAAPTFEAYLAASNITKSVALEFEGILIEKFDPPFNERSRASTGWPAWPPARDTRAETNSAEQIGIVFTRGPPAKTHISEWDRFSYRLEGSRRKYWLEIPAEWIITRVSNRPKFNQTDVVPHEIVHYNSYPERGESTTVAVHRARNEGAHQKLDWNTIKRILYWDSTYIDADGPIITITPPNQV